MWCGGGSVGWVVCFGSLVLDFMLWVLACCWVLGLGGLGLDCFPEFSDLVGLL